jgi:hypothetical protein
MSTLIKLIAIAAFVVVGGFLVSLAGGLIDRQLDPDCNLCRLAALALFTTFAVVFGVLEFVWPVSDQGDALPWH